MIDDELDAARRSFMSPAPALEPAAPTTPSTLDDELDAHRRAFMDNAGIKPQEIPAYHRSFVQDMSDLGHGIAEGYERVARPAAGIIASAVGPGGWTDRRLGMHIPLMNSADTVAQEAAARRQAFEQAHGGGFGIAGTILGQTAATAPLLAGAGAGLAAGATRLGAAVPAIKPALNATTEFVSGQSGGVGNRLMQIGSRGTQGAITGAGSTALVGDTDPNSLLLGAGGGAAGGIALPLLAEGASRMFGGTSRMSTPVANFINNAKDTYGIDLRAAQVPGGLPPTAEALRNASKYVVGSGATAVNAPVLKQWQSAVADYSGVKGQALTKQAIDNARQKVGVQMMRFEAQPASLAHIAPDLFSLKDTINQAGGADAPVVTKIISDLTSKAALGDSYGSLLATVDNAAKMTAAPTVLKSLGEIRTSIQDAIETHADQTPFQLFKPGSKSAAESPPMPGSLYQHLRGQAYSLGVLDRANIGPDGKLSPQALQAAMSASPPPPSARMTLPHRQDAAGNSLPTPAVALPDLARIGSVIGQPDSAMDIVRRGLKIAEPLGALGAHFLAAGGGLNPVVPSIAIGTSGGSRLMNLMLGSKALTNRLVSNSGKGVAPWVGGTQDVAGPLGAAAANALMR